MQSQRSRKFHAAVSSRMAIAVLLTTTLIGCTTDKNADSLTDQVAAIFPKGEQGAAELFTGKAWNYGLVGNDSIFTTLVGNVYFEPGARSNWHTHPAGQILIITDGVGYHQIEGRPIEIIRKGDVVKCPPNVRHWHGASADVGLQQLYIVPNTEQGTVNWEGPVSDAEYTNR